MPVIRVEQLSKAYRLGLIGGGTLRDDLSRWWARVRNRPDPKLKIGKEHLAERFGEQFWALKDVSFDVEQGEVLGIIGRNGAGKSTLLKILSQVTAPTEGLVKLKGRVASLLEVGTGFHHELTGRENIFLNGAILGMTKREIESKFDEIVAFSEVEQFIDTPVKRYSSGMYVRLAFAVAAHLEPEILIVDEVLAVGDAGFQKKCLGKMSDVSHEGRTVLFVSHNMASVQSLCNRSLVLEHGKIGFDGRTEDAVTHYLSDMEQQRAVPLAERGDRWGSGELRFTGVEFLDPETRESVQVIMTGQPVLIRVSYECLVPQGLRDVSIGISFWTSAGTLLATCPSRWTGVTYDVRHGFGTAECRLPRMPLRASRYAYSVFGSRFDRAFDIVRYAGTLEVHPADYYGSGFPVPPSDPAVMVGYEWVRPAN